MSWFPASRPASRALYAAAIIALAAPWVHGNLLDFEHTPDGSSPVDNAALTTPYAIDGGTVGFFFDTNGDNIYQPDTDVAPHFELVGAQANDGARGFRGTFEPEDSARDLPGLSDQLGNWFLRKQGDVDTATPTPFVFIADYDTTTPIRSLSGEIWDIDSVENATEQWQVDVLDASNQVIASALSPVGILQTDPNSLDGRPWQFSFNNLTGDADKIRMTFVGTKQSGIGIAFNNFSPTVSVPEPAGLGAMLVAGMVGLRRRPD
ncbi:MAG: motif protein [Phycisphaerales bacterium]|nr:motif protein [Phycisphaerales bacterium]